MGVGKALEEGRLCNVVRRQGGADNTTLAIPTKMELLLLLTKSRYKKIFTIVQIYVQSKTKQECVSFQIGSW